MQSLTKMSDIEYSKWNEKRIERS